MQNKQMTRLYSSHKLTVATPQLLLSKTFSKNASFFDAQQNLMDLSRKGQRKDIITTVTELHLAFTRNSTG